MTRPIHKSESQVYDFITEACAQEPAVQRVILFGSRARGDQHEKSDFDIAIDAPGISDESWARLALHLRDDAPTLCGLDVVRLDEETSPELSAKIDSEGVQLYVRK